MPPLSSQCLEGECGWFEGQTNSEHVRWQSAYNNPVYLNFNFIIELEKMCRVPQYDNGKSSAQIDRDALKKVFRCFPVPCPLLLHG